MNVKTIRDDTRAAIDDILGALTRAGEVARERLEDLGAQANAVVSFLDSELASPVLEKAAALFVHDLELMQYAGYSDLRRPGDEPDDPIELSELHLRFQDIRRGTQHSVLFKAGSTHLRPGRYRLALVFLPLEDAEGKS